MDKKQMNRLTKNLQLARALEEKYPEKYSEYTAILCKKCKWQAGPFVEVTQCQWCLAPMTPNGMPCPYYLTSNG